ncbi:hypothetical protein [Streptomyces calidiresistens]|uniref:Lipoprotein n=1 Tax=Streptomyces calidiresistens TaxID=1485586 RepID=A0A7W3XVC8_9ACTN|nr:hypothetical protein [Streptomyces calidiresistens]MBB0228624.1 hypothetical protein [Streptomyces calidiresistens]
MTLRTKGAALAAATATALLLTACGGSGDGNDAPIAGTDQGTENTPEPEETTTGDEPEDTDGDHPEIELPDDVELVFDWDTPEDPDEAAALKSLETFLSGTALAIVEQDPEHPIYRNYSSDGAQSYARGQIQAWMDGGWTLHGTERYYALEVSRTDNSDDVLGFQFCIDTTEMHGKDVDSGEPLDPTDQVEGEGLYRFQYVMRSAPGVENFWQAQHVDAETEASRCR